VDFGLPAEGEEFGQTYDPATPTTLEERELAAAEAFARGGGIWPPLPSLGPGAASSAYGAPGQSSVSGVGAMASSGFGVPTAGLIDSSAGSHSYAVNPHRSHRPELDASLFKGVGFERDPHREAKDSINPTRGWNFAADRSCAC
jgi:hypothetical protein